MPLYEIRRSSRPPRPRHSLLFLCLAVMTFAGCGAGGGAVPSTATASSALSAADSAVFSTASASWTESFHDAGHTGYNPAETSLSSSTVPNLSELAGQTVPGGDLALTLSGGRLFSLAAGTSGGDVLTAMNPTTMAIEWTTTTGGNNLASIAAANGVVVAPCRLGTAGDYYEGVCGYSEKTGAPLWSWGSPCNCSPESGLATPIVYANGIVYFAYALAGAYDGTPFLVAVNEKTGAQIEMDQIGNGPDQIWPDAPVVAGGLIYFSCYNEVCAYNASSGAQVWTYPTGSTQNALTYAGSTLYVHYTGSSTGVLALSGSNGSLLHSYPYCPTGCRNGSQPVAIAKTMMYVTSPDGYLHAYHINGQSAWTAGGGAVASTPSVANGVVYVVNNNVNVPTITAYNASTGAALWNGPYTGYTFGTPPVIANGIVYADSATCGNVCAYSVH